jgi:hypothetical protein
MWTAVLAFALPLACLLPLNSRAAVVINEINYHPDSDQELEEFIELYNTGDAPVVLTDWKFVEGTTFTFPNLTMIGAREYLVVARDRTFLANLFGITNVIGNFEGRLDNTGERLTLHDDAGTTVDTVLYNDKWPWPAAPDGTGCSLELVNPDDDNDHPRNWRGSTSGTAVEEFQHDAVVFTHRHSQTADQVISMRISDVPIRVEPTRTLQSIQLPPAPPSGRIFVLGITLFNGATYTYIDLSSLADTDGFTYNSLRTDGNLDGGGYTYAAEEMTSSGGYTACRAPGHSAIRWRTPNVTNGAMNCIRANAQVVTVPAGSYTHVYFLATATGTSTINSFANLMYADGGMNKPFEITDWARAKAIPAHSINRSTPGARNSIFATNTPPFISECARSADSPRSTETVTVTARVTDADGVNQVLLHYEVNETATATLTMLDDGAHGDGAAGDGLYGATIPAQASQSIVAYWFEARDDAGRTERFPYAAEPEEAIAYFVYNGEVVTNLPVEWLYYRTAPIASSDETVPATFVDSERRVYYHVQARNRGAWARSWPKKCWKIYFNKGNELGGNLGTLNLNSNWNDEILMREHICYEICRFFNYPACETRLVHFRTNGAFQGVYVEVEQPGRAFLDRNGLDTDGSLYKACDNGVYPPRSNERKLDPTTTYMTVYEKKTREWEDYSDLIRWTWDLDATPTAQTLEYLKKTTDLWRLTEYIAINCIIANWDHVGKNHYDFRDSVTNKWLQLPWDCDRTLGEYTSPGYRTNQPIDYGRTEVPGPSGMYSYLHDRFLEDPRIVPFYHRVLRRFCNLVFTEKRMHPVVDRTRALMGADAQLDYNLWKGAASYDAQWTYWRNTYDYVRDRRAFILSQIPAEGDVVINEFMASNDNGPRDEFGDLDDWVELYNPKGTTVTLGGCYLTDNLSTPTRWRIPDGVRIGPRQRLVFWCDGEPGEGPYHTNFKLTGAGEEIGLFDTDANGNLPIDWWTFGWQEPDVSVGRNGDGAWDWVAYRTPSLGTANPVRSIGKPPVTINEWMASNQRTIADERLEYEDWIELYNDSDEPVCVGGRFLTDAAGRHDYWMIPYCTVIGPKGFLLFWSDSQPRQGAMHTNYRLDAAGGEIVLYDSDTSTVIDAVRYGAQTTDVTEGRYPDGTSTIKVLSHPTPGAPNFQPSASVVTRWREY